MQRRDATYDEQVNAWWVLVPLSYLVGSFPTAHLIGRLAGIDPTAQGSKNPGASNVYRVAGRRAGAAVLLGDALKGFVPAALGVAADGRPLGVACGLAAVVGHIIPATRGFRGGGKGVATLGGACFFLYPLVAVGLLVTFALAVRLFRTASLGSIAMAVLLPVAVGLRGRPGWEIAAMAAASVVIIVRHWPNIVRILHNEERVLRS